MEKALFFLRHCAPPPEVTKKLFRIMRITTVLLIIACLHVSARGWGQQVTLSLKDAPLTQVFSAIRAQTGYTFAYAESLISKSRRVTVNLANVDLAEALKACFAGQP